MPKPVNDTTNPFVKIATTESGEIEKPAESKPKLTKRIVANVKKHKNALIAGGALTALVAVAAAAGRASASIPDFSSPELESNDVVEGEVVFVEESDIENA